MIGHSSAQDRPATTLFLVLSLLMGWVAHSAWSQGASGEQNDGVIRARRVLMEDADGRQRGHLAWDSGRLVLEAQGGEGEPAIRLALCPGDDGSYVTVAGNSGTGAVRIAAGRNPWIMLGYEDTARFVYPGVSMGLNSRMPTLALNDADRPRAMLWVIDGMPQLGLYDAESELFWHTPEQ